MKFYNPNGKEYTLTLSSYRQPKNNPSKPHKEARQLLADLFPCDQILEEVPIKIDRQTLYLDFFLSTRRLAVEVNGEQHRQFNSFHYNNKLDFIQAQKRDRQKEQWCELNNIELVVLDDDRQEYWKDTLQG